MKGPSPAGPLALLALGCASTPAPVAARVTATPVAATAAPVAVPLLDDALPANAVLRSVMDVPRLAPLAAPLVDGEFTQGRVHLVDGWMFLRSGAPGQFALDPYRPVRSATYEVPPDLRAYLDRVIELASRVEVPPDLPAYLDRVASSADGRAELRRRGRSAEARALMTALDHCPAGGTVTRILIPTRDRARTVAALRAWLTASTNDPPPVSLDVPGYDFAVVFQQSSAGGAMAVASNARFVALDAYTEPLLGCQPEAERTSLVERAARALRALRFGEASAGEAEPLELRDAALRIEAIPERQVYSTLFMGLGSMLAVRDRGGPGTMFEPDAIPLAMAGAVGDSALALEFARGPRGPFARRAGYAVFAEVDGLSLTFEAERAGPGYGPPDDVSIPEARLFPSGTPRYVDAATAWLGAFALPGDRAPGDLDHTRFDQHVREGGHNSDVLSAPFGAMAVVRTLLQDAPPLLPHGTPLSPRFERVGVGRSASGRLFTYAQLAAGTSASDAACALAAPAVPCARVRLRRGVVVAVPGGFARWVNVAGLHAVVLSASRATAGAVALAPATGPAAPVAGWFEVEGSFDILLLPHGNARPSIGPLALFTWMAAPLESSLAPRYHFEASREGDVFRYALRPAAPAAPAPASR